MRAIGDEVKLFYRLEYGEPPRRGDVLVTKTGCHYFILEVKRGRSRYRIRCVVVPPEIEYPGCRFRLVWDKRR